MYTLNGVVPQFISNSLCVYCIFRPMSTRRIQFACVLYSIGLHELSGLLLYTWYNISVGPQAVY